MRWQAFRVIAVVGAAILAWILFARAPLGHQLVVKAYFENGMGLRVGARVRLAGVDVGSVKSVRARPELKEAPVEVVMALNPPHELNLPKDSIAQLETLGVLGETFVDIDARRASGPPIGANDVLGTRTTEQTSTQQFLDGVKDVLRDQRCKCSDRSNDSSSSTPAKKSPAGNPADRTSN